MRYLFSCAACLLAATRLCCTAAGQAVCAVSARADPRLTVRVNIPAQDMYAGDLAERLAHLTGAQINCYDAEQAGDAPLFVRINNLPAAAVMETLQSELSFKDADWGWEVSKDTAGRPVYLLVRSRASRTMPATLKEWVRQHVTAEARLLTKLATLTVDQRLQHVKELAADLLQTDDTVATAILHEHRTMQGYRVFAGLPQDVQTRILDGTAGVNISVSSLNADGRAYVTDEWHLANSAGGTRPMPTSLHVYATRFNAAVAPGLVIEMENLGGYGYAGGRPTEIGIRRLVDASWLQGDDSLTDARESATYKPVEAKGYYGIRHPIRDPLFVAAGRTGVSLIARLQSESGSGMHGMGLSNAPTTLGAMLELLRNDGLGAWHKWHRGVLLVDDFTWIAAGGDEPPWPVVKRLWQAVRAGNGVPSVNALVLAACSLTPAQAANLPEPLNEIERIAIIHELAVRLRLTPAAAARLALGRGLVLPADVAAWLVDQPPISKLLAGKTLRSVYFLGGLAPGPQPYVDLTLYGDTAEGKRLVIDGVQFHEIGANQMPGAPELAPPPKPGIPTFVLK